MFGNRRGIYVATGALLTTLVLTSGSLLTFLLISPEIEKGKDRNNLDVARNVLRDLDTHIRELLAKGANTSSVFRMVFPKGELVANPTNDVLTYSVKTQVDYDLGSTSTLEADRNEDTDVLTIRSMLPVDLVTKNTKIKPGRYVVSLYFEREAKFRVANWNLYKNATFEGTVGSTTGSYYVTELREDALGADINRNGNATDFWFLYLSDPNEDYVFDSFAIHDSDGVLLEVLQEGDSFHLDGIPLMVYKVRERYVVFRYAMIRMEVQ